MNILTSELPTQVQISNTSYNINYDFRTMIKLEQLILDSEVNDFNKIVIALQLFYGELQEEFNVEEAINKLLWFYRGGEAKNNINTFSKIKQIYSFEYDGDYIYAAFLEQYGIDLQTSNMHWWRFKALFRALKEDTEIVKIMGYRSVDLNKIENKEERERYRKLQKLYKIPEPKAKEERKNKIEEALLKGEIPEV